MKCMLSEWMKKGGNLINIDRFIVDAVFTDVTLAKRIASQLNQKFLIAVALSNHIRSNTYWHIGS